MYLLRTISADVACTTASNPNWPVQFKHLQSYRRLPGVLQGAGYETPNGTGSLFFDSKANNYESLVRDFMSYDRCVWRDNRLLALTVTELILKRFLTIQERKKFMSPQFCYEDFKSLEDIPHAPAEIRALLKFLYQPYVESVRETTCLNTSYREFQSRYILEASTVLRHLTKLLDKLGGGAGAVGYRPPVYWTEEDERLRQEELARVKREYAVKAQRGREDALRRVRAHKGAIQFDLLSEEERQKEGLYLEGEGTEGNTDGEGGVNAAESMELGMDGDKQEERLVKENSGDREDGMGGRVELRVGGTSARSVEIELHVGGWAAGTVPTDLIVRVYVQHNRPPTSHRSPTLTADSDPPGHPAEGATTLADLDATIASKLLIVWLSLPVHVDSGQSGIAPEQLNPPDSIEAKTTWRWAPESESRSEEEPAGGGGGGDGGGGGYLSVRVTDLEPRHTYHLHCLCSSAMLSGVALHWLQLRSIAVPPSLFLALESSPALQLEQLSYLGGQTFYTTPSPPDPPQLTLNTFHTTVRRVGGNAINSHRVDLVCADGLRSPIGPSLTRVAVKWLVPHNNGYPILEVQLHRRVLSTTSGEPAFHGVGEGVMTRWTKVFSGLGESYAEIQESSSTALEFRARARNRLGWGPFSTIQWTSLHPPALLTALARHTAFLPQPLVNEEGILSPRMSQFEMLCPSPARSSATSPLDTAAVSKRRLPGRVTDAGSVLNSPAALPLSNNSTCFSTGNSDNESEVSQGRYPLLDEQDRRQTEGGRGNYTVEDPVDLQWLQRLADCCPIEVAND
eukprot:gene2373-2851_t